MKKHILEFIKEEKYLFDYHEDGDYYEYVVDCQLGTSDILSLCHSVNYYNEELLNESVEFMVYEYIENEWGWDYYGDGMNYIYSEFQNYLNKNNIEVDENDLNDISELISEYICIRIDMSFMDIPIPSYITVPIVKDFKDNITFLETLIQSQNLTLEELNYLSKLVYSDELIVDDYKDVDSLPYSKFVKTFTKESIEAFETSNSYDNFSDIIYNEDFVFLTEFTMREILEFNKFKNHLSENSQEYDKHIYLEIDKDSSFGICDLTGYGSGSMEIELNSNMLITMNGIKTFDINIMADSGKTGTPDHIFGFSYKVYKNDTTLTIIDMEE